MKRKRKQSEEVEETNIHLKDGDIWWVGAASIGATWSLECCGCGLRHRFELVAADESGAYLITITRA